jgi:hypothetical protein
MLSSGLACGCSTFVSTSQQIAVSDLMDLKQQWDGANCGAGIVCGPCEQPSGAYCEPKGNVGACIDVY